MYVTSLSVDRFGACFDLRLDGLSGGLNVVFGPPGSGKASTVDFLRAVLGGFDSDLQDRYAIHSSPGSGGSITVQSGSGRQIISRHDDGSRDGRLTVERPDGSVIGWRHLRDVLGDIPLSLLDLAFCVDFDRRPELDNLLVEAAACGLMVSAEQQDSDRGRVADQELAEVAQRISVLRREIAAVERSLAELDGRQQRLLSGQVQHAPEPGSPDPHPAELREIDAQLRRSKRTLRDIVARRRRAAKIADRRLVRASSAITLPEPRRILRSLEQRIHDLQAAMQHAAPLANHNCQCQSLHATCAESLRQMEQDVYAVCSAISLGQARDRRRQASEARDRLTRCEMELRHAIRSLARRRRTLLRRLNSKRPDLILHPEVQRLCQCAAHPSASATPREHAAPDASATRKLAGIRAEIQRLANTRIEWMTEVADLEHELVERRVRRSRCNDEPETLVSAASEFLRGLTARQWRRIRVTDHGAVAVEDATGRWTDYLDLDTGGRDQLYLSFCMAIMTSCERRGWQLPLVINAVFTDCPSRKVGDALETLREFGRGRQVLCFTRHEHVANVARQLRIPVRPLRIRDSQPVRHAPDDSSFPAAIVPIAAEAPAGGIEPPVVTGYLLYEHDPIERAPSLDETNAARLRAAGVSRVGDLLRLEPGELAAELRPFGVTVEMIEAWQSQARLVCRLRGLRPYDARILVACGVRDPEQLVHLQPGALRARVKEFAASPRGQAIILSGTEYELSRVTDWIGAARDALGEEQDFPSERSEPRVDPRAAASARRHSRSTARATRPELSPGPCVNSESDTAAADQEVSPAIVPIDTIQTEWRFYLRRSDAIADAPSIGPAMAKRLEAAGIRTVQDLLQSDAEAVATKLGMRRISGELIRRWQQQCELVCRVPRLRGHDAQIIVAAGVSSVDQLATAVPGALWRSIEHVLKSHEGKRLPRGVKEPDLAAVTAWIESARHARTLLAA